MLSSHSIAGANFEELKCSVPSDSVFKPLYTRHAEGATAQTGTYAEARECEHCNHVGINDSAEGVATCVACQWIGDSPKEDKCPDCEAEGTMTASCPKCHHEYRLIADATLADPHPTQQGMEQPIKWPKARDVGRFGDMSPDGSIRVGLDADNDVYVSICDGTSVADIEFCTPGGGGGRSSRTRMALIALMCAIEADNASHPAFDFWQRNLAAQAKQKD